MIWRRNLHSPISTRALLHQGRLYVGTDDGRIVGMAPGDGAIEAQLPVGAAPYGSLVAAGGALVFFVDWMRKGGEVLCVDPALTHVRWWQGVIDEAVWTSVRPLVFAGLVLCGDSAGTLYALEPADGSPVWTYGVDGSVRSLGSHGSVLYVGTIDGLLYALRLEPKPAPWSMRRGRS